jgi:predicted trehalose synthase
MIYVKSHQNELQAEAAANRLAKQAKRSGSRSAGRIGTALTSVRSLLTSSAEGPSLPNLTDYPYRS